MAVTSGRGQGGHARACRRCRCGGPPSWPRRCEPPPEATAASERAQRCDEPSTRCAPAGRAATVPTHLGERPRAPRRSPGRTRPRSTGATHAGYPTRATRRRRRHRAAARTSCGRGHHDRTAPAVGADAPRPAPRPRAPRCVSGPTTIARLDSPATARAADVLVRRSARRACGRPVSAAAATSGVVGDEHDGLAAGVQPAKQLDHLLAALGVERAVGSSASSRVGSLARARAMASRWRWPPESTPGTAAALSPMPSRSSRSRARRLGHLALAAGDDRRQRHVLEDGHALEEVEELEDDADVAPAQPGELVLGPPGHQLAGHHDVPSSGDVEPGHQVEQRRLAAPRGPHQGHELAGRDGQVDAAQRPHRRVLGLEGLAHAVSTSQGCPCHGSAPPCCSWHRRPGRRSGSDARSCRPTTGCPRPLTSWARRAPRSPAACASASNGRLGEHRLARRRPVAAGAGTGSPCRRPGCTRGAPPSRAAPPPPRRSRARCRARRRAGPRPPSAG